MQIIIYIRGHSLWHCSIQGVEGLSCCFRGHNVWPYESLFEYKDRIWWKGEEQRRRIVTARGRAVRKTLGDATSWSPELLRNCELIEGWGVSFSGSSSPGQSTEQRQCNASFLLWWRCRETEHLLPGFPCRVQLIAGDPSRMTLCDRMIVKGFL